MINLISLLVVAALVYSQTGWVSGLPTKTGGPKRVLGDFLNISEPPPEKVRFTPGTDLILTCEVSGRPAPSVRWVRNGELVDEFDQDPNEILTPHPNGTACLISKLVIPAAENGDVFACIASGGNKHQATSTTVYVEPEDETDELLTLHNLITRPSKPIISTYYDFILQNQYTSVLLPCRVTSYTKPQVFWQDNNNRLIYDDARRRVLPSGDLLITNMDFKYDMGEYTCIVKNAFGKDSITTFVYPMAKSRAT